MLVAGIIEKPITCRKKGGRKPGAAGPARSAPGRHESAKIHVGTAFTRVKVRHLPSPSYKMFFDTIKVEFMILRIRL